MAIQGKFTYRGLDIENAYVRIDEVHGGKLMGWRGLAKLYYSKETAAAPGTINAFTEFEVATTEWHADVSPYPVLYVELKKLEQFKDFVDA